MRTGSGFVYAEPLYCNNHFSIRAVGLVLVLHVPILNSLQIPDDLKALLHKMAVGTP